jgi:2'-5' RNA ligase
MTGEREQPPEESYRLFIALEVPEAVRSELERAQQRLRREVSGGVIRWARQDQLHLTLRFLGDVEAGRVPELIQGLQRACGQFAALEMRAGGIGFFPSPQRPRVIWAGATDTRERLTALAGAITQATLTFCAEPSETRFAGHITLGRIKDLSSVARAAGRETGRFYGEWVALEIALIRSRLASSGSTYSRLAGVPLAGGGV